MVGLIISFGLAVGRSARFYTRFSAIEVASVAEEKGWEAWLVLPVEVFTGIQCHLPKGVILKDYSL